MLDLENRGGGPLRKSNLLKLLSIIFAFALIAAACGGDDDDSGSSSDSSVLGEDSSEEEDSASDSDSEPADKEEDHDHSDDDGHDHSDDEDHSDEAAGTADDSTMGDGAELWESIVDGGVVEADESAEPVLITLVNIEGTPVGSFPEIREGAEAAVKTINETMGGLNGRPFELESCVHGLDPNEATACANEIADAQPNLHIQGIDFFNPLLWPTFVGAGLPVLQTVPIFIEDFDTEGILSTEGGCVSSFPTAMEYGVETLDADKFVIIYSNTAPGLVCYEDTEARMIQQLTDEGKIAQEDWIGVVDASGDPTDNDAVVQQVLEFVEGAENAWVFFGIQASDCNEIMSALAANGYEGGIVTSGACRDDSVLANPASAGVHFGSNLGIPERPDLWSDYKVKYYEWREASLDRYGPTVPQSAFMEVAHDVVITGLLQMIMFDAMGGDVDNDPAGFIEFMATQSNMHRAGSETPLDCTTNSPEFVSVCAKDMGYYPWTGPGGQFEYGPLGPSNLDSSELILRAAEGNPRPTS